MTFKIEKDVPIPTIGRRALPSLFPFSEMAIGDSFVMRSTDVPLTTMLARVYRQAKRYGQLIAPGFTVRAQIIESGKAARVWRIAPQDASTPVVKRPIGDLHAAVAAMPKGVESYVHNMDDKRKAR